MALGHLGADSALAIMVIVLALVAMTAVARRLRDALVPLAERIDAVLPQTHCAQCGYGGCMPYANAVAAGAAAINRCPPGGPPVIRKLARITGRPYADLDPACGSPKPRQLAVIDEARCIGCTLCIRACPVDAIVGASKLMHTVIASECTGCELCLPPCPVDCIALVPAPWTLADYVLRKKAHSEENARKRYAARARRLERDRLEHAARLARATAERAARASTMPEQPDRKQQIVAAAIARARRKLAEREQIEA